MKCILCPILANLSRQDGYQKIKHGLKVVLISFGLLNTVDLLSFFYHFKGPPPHLNPKKFKKELC